MHQARIATWSCAESARRCAGKSFGLGLKVEQVVSEKVTLDEDFFADL